MSERESLDLRDLRVDTYTGGIGTATHMRVTHLPTGLAVTGEGRSHISLRNELVAQLTQLVTASGTR